MITLFVFIFVFVFELNQTHLNVNIFKKELIERNLEKDENDLFDSYQVLSYLLDLLSDEMKIEENYKNEFNDNKESINDLVKLN